jgi:hypothetical protein
MGPVTWAYTVEYSRRSVSASAFKVDLPMVECSLDGVELEDVLFPVRVIGSTRGNGFVMSTVIGFLIGIGVKVEGLWVVLMRFGGHSP